MKIKITHISNTLNNGGLIMAINTIKKISELSGHKAEIFTDTSGELNIARLKDGLAGDYRLAVDTFSNYNPSYNYRVTGNLANKLFKFYKKTIAMKRIVAKELEQIDAVIVLGGDDISQYYEKSILLKELYTIRTYSSRKPVFLLGQTIGPFNPFFKAIARSCLKRTVVYSRDLDSYNYVRGAIGHANTHLSADIAFLDLPRQEDSGFCPSTLASYGLCPGGYITIVPSGLFGHYTTNRVEYISCFVELIKRIAVMPEFKDGNIALLAHVLQPAEVDDRAVINEVYRRLPEGVKRKVRLVTDDLQPVALRHILGNGRLTVTGRMHAAISSIQMGKPAVCLSYSVKYGGVIGRSLGLPELVIESTDAVIWKDGSLVDNIVERMKTVDKDYEAVSEKIRLRVTELKETLENQFKDIMARIEERG